MAFSAVGSKMEIRTHFSAREGVYKHLPQTEFCRMNRVPYSPITPGQPSNVAPVKASFVDIEHEGVKITRIVFVAGKDIFYYDYEGVLPSQPVDYSQPLDRRVYKGVLPTCHAINEHTATLKSLKVAVGFAAGQVQIIDVGSRQSLQIFNEERMVEKTGTTCVHWVPGTESLVISSHSNGIMYTYDISHKNMNVVPVYHDKPKKVCGDISVYTLKNRNYSTQAGIPLGVLKNPLYKWVVTPDSSAIHEFKFSPDARTIAIVSQDGYMRLIDYVTLEHKGAMKSYFGGLLCCCWSPDGRYIVTGGEDDLVTVWSFYGRFVVARGYGHRSWISHVAFDPFLCLVPEEDEVLRWYGSDSPALTRNSIRGRSLNRNYFKYETAADFKSTETTSVNAKSPVAKLQNLSRRNRTDSTVSKTSKISVAESIDARPRVSYRFGSAGQDAQLCLWELTDDVLFPRRRTTSMLRSYGCAHFVRTEASPVKIANGKRDSSYSDSGSLGLNESQTVNGKGKHGTSNGSPGSGKESSHSITRGFTFFSKSSSKDSTSMTEGKFATLAIGESPSKKEQAKSHKRNLSMPYFGTKNGSKSQSTVNGVSRTEQSKESKPALTLGTNLCPRLDETAMLEPLVCKLISQGRLTWLSFQKDSIMTAGQDGCIQTWARPHKSEGSAPVTAQRKDLPRQSVNSPTPSPKLSPVKVPPGTQVR